MKKSNRSAARARIRAMNPSRTTLKKRLRESQDETFVVKKQANAELRHLKRELSVAKERDHVYALCMNLLDALEQAGGISYSERNAILEGKMLHTFDREGGNRMPHAVPVIYAPRPEDFMSPSDWIGRNLIAPARCNNPHSPYGVAEYLHPLVFAAYAHASKMGHNLRMSLMYGSVSRPAKTMELMVSPHAMQSPSMLFHSVHELCVGYLKGALPAIRKEMGRNC